MVTFYRPGEGDPVMKHRAAPLALLLTLTLLALGLPALAKDEPPTTAPPDADGGTSFLQAPPPPNSPVTGDAVEPEITIREAGDQTIYEYRVRGMLYMVKIQPQFGPPYFLVDTDGNGTWDQRSSAPTNISIPQWVLFTWH
jgi:hypothetical protein